MSFTPQTCPAPAQDTWQSNGVEQCMVWPIYDGSDSSPCQLPGQLFCPMIVSCVGIVQGMGMVPMGSPMAPQSALLHPSPVHPGRMACDRPAESLNSVRHGLPTADNSSTCGAAGRPQLPSLMLATVNTADITWEEMDNSDTSCGLRTPSPSPRFSRAYMWNLDSSDISRDSLCASPAPSAAAASDLEADLTSCFGDPEDMTDERFDDLVIYLEGLSASNRKLAVLQVPGLIWRLASTPHGSRLLQEVLEGADARLTAQLAAGLQGRVNEAWESPSAAPHANHVLQRCIELLPPELCHFVLKEMLTGSIERASCSKYGCRIVQRLIEHFPAEKVLPLVEQLLKKDTLLKLMISRFGNFVIQCLLERGSEEQKQIIAAAVIQQDDHKFTKLAENMYASHVVQRAMKHCPEHIQSILIDRIMRIESKDSKFKRSVYGSFVVHEAKKWVKVHGESPTFPKFQQQARRGGQRRGGSRINEGGGSASRQPALPRDASRAGAQP